MRKRRPPNTAAVVITCRNGAYESKLREAKAKVNIVELGIPNMVPKRAVTEGYMFEVAGEDRAAKADKLAAKLREAIGEKGSRSLGHKKWPS